ncbi:hypothetical protein [Streptomyces tsukubensis]|uniref:PH domain-containing protein n=1 Tax=Streptomyces tsukubensis TaxID=83656 RepID=A0A1V4A5T3_9ACTN|nr:hypothetical protein [Streptomyces tsukubensis]OON76469.1 hypothetical protein B1H18_21300 [Streptomyces tsukubensis]QFR96046.1 hypothetical protein GBW32_27095 [Streptomyces tsukubensis]
MPLPFLTADRAFDETADDTALPFDDRESWRRPYRPGPWRVGAAAVLLLLASFVLFAAMIIVLAGAYQGAVVCAVVAVVIIAAATRLVRSGAWVCAQGLRRVGFLTTRTFSWSQITSIRTVQQPVRLLGTPRTVQGQAVVVAVKRHDSLGPLLTDHNADFLSRPEAFERAADVLEVWAEEYGHSQA